MSRFFGVGLIALEVVNRRRNCVASLLARTDGRDIVASTLQYLQWDHRFVVFDKVTDKH
jgi:hypothetical protein